MLLLILVVHVLFGRKDLNPFLVILFRRFRKNRNGDDCCNDQNDETNHAIESPVFPHGMSFQSCSVVSEQLFVSRVTILNCCCFG